MRSPSRDIARRGMRRGRTALLAAGIALAGCTPSGLLSPIPEVDVGTRTAAVPAYAPAPAPTFPAEPAFSEPTPAPMDLPVEASIDAQPMPDAPQFADAPPFAEPAAQPSQEAPVQVAAAPAQARGMQTLVPSNPYMTSLPRVTPELQRPSGMPEGEVACRRQLRRLGVQFVDLEPINDGGACAIDYPVKVSGLPSGIGMRPAATLTCQMALAFSSWAKDELNPAARRRYFSGVKTVHQGSSYSCRRIAGTRTASEHSKGNALDVMRIELNSGRDIDVRKPGFFRFREKSLLNTVRAGGCDYFTTVLGPGYNRDHADHFHFDIKNRRNGYVACR